MRGGEPIEVTGRELSALDDEVGTGEQLVDTGARPGADDRALSGVQVLEQRAVAGAELGARSAPPPQRIPVGRFDLHDVGARVAQQLRRVGTGDLRRHIEHADPAEQGHAPCVTSGRKYGNTNPPPMAWNSTTTRSPTTTSS